MDAENNNRDVIDLSDDGVTNESVEQIGDRYVTMILIMIETKNFCFF